MVLNPVFLFLYHSNPGKVCTGARFFDSIVSVMQSGSTVSRRICVFLCKMRTILGADPDTQTQPGAVAFFNFFYYYR